MLTVTRNMGMSEQAALISMERSVSADQDALKGIVYFADRPNEVRSKTRQPGFEDAVSGLRNLGIKSVVENKPLPEGLQVSGAVLGEQTFDWEKSGNTISPGSIVENLTSCGGMIDNTAHTKATKFIEWGAAGSSGTVIEPYAIQAKFPHPMISGPLRSWLFVGRGILPIRAWSIPVVDRWRSLVPAVCEPPKF